MPLGSALVSTIEIDFTRAQGANSSGKILFQPPRVVVGTTMLSTRSVVAQISEGLGSVTLARLPAGTYHVTEMIDNQEPYEWDFSLTLSAAATIQYENIAAVSPVPAIYTYVRTVNGVPPDPVTGNVEVAGGGGSTNLDGLTDVVIAAPVNGQALVYDGADTRWENRALVTGDISGFQTAVDARVQLIVDAAPIALDTLNELAAALNDDPNFAATVTTSLAEKQPLDSDLTTIAGLAPADDDLLQRISGAWASRTPAQVKTSLGLVKDDVGLGNVTDTAQVPLSLFDAAGDLLVGSGDNTATRLARGTDGQILKVVAGALAYADPAFDPGHDILGLYGFHSGSVDPDDLDDEFPWNNEIWIARVMVRAGRAVTKIGTLIQTAGVLGAGGLNGFAIGPDDGSTAPVFTVDDDNLWTVAGVREKLLGGSAIAPQSVDKVYRCQMAVQGYSTAPQIPLATNKSILTEVNTRVRFSNAAAGFQGPYNPATFGTATGGAVPPIWLG